MLVTFVGLSNDLSIRLDKVKRRMSGFLKFNSSLLDEKDFRDLLELMKKRKLSGGGYHW